MGRETLGKNPDSNNTTIPSNPGTQPWTNEFTYVLIGISVSVIVIIIIAIASYFIYRRRNRANQNQARTTSEGEQSIDPWTHLSPIQKRIFSVGAQMRRLEKFKDEHNAAGKQSRELQSNYEFEKWNRMIKIMDELIEIGEMGAPK